MALVVSHLRGGGKEQCIVDLANGLGEGPFRPVVICLGGGGPLEGRIRPDRATIIRLGKRPGNDLALPVRLARTLGDQQVEVVHSNNWGTLAETVIAAGLARVRHLVHTQHGLDYGAGDAPADGRQRIRMLAKRLTARRVNRFAAVSHEVGEVLIRDWRVAPEKVFVIHNGVHLQPPPLAAHACGERRRALGLGPDDRVVGSVGIFRPVKDFPALIEAMAEVVREAPQAKLVLIGDGPSRGDIEAGVRRFGLERHVRFLGLRFDVAELLPLLDVFVLSSVSEGISLSILEAMAAGVPVVATAVGGTPEILDSEDVGVLVPPRSPSATARAILALLRDAGRRRAMGARARDRVERSFSVARMTADYERLYTSLVG